MTHKTDRERGVIAIFFASIIALLLFTTTTYAARVTVSELNQASQVDRSEAAYYAAEAGIEQAIRTIDLAPETASVQEMFPEQFTSSVNQPGDTYTLEDDAGNAFVANAVSTDDNSASRGELSWRHRRVYSQSVTYTGTQVKDETQQIDATLLQRRCTGGATIDDSDPTASTPDCLFPGTLHGNFKGIQYCWTPNTPGARIELTVVSYPNASPTSITTAKYITDGTAPLVGPTFSVDPAAAALAAYSYCFNYNVNPANRYIFRMKPIFPTVGAPAPVNSSQNQYSVKYRAQLVETVPVLSANQRMYIPNDSYLIDVVGESGDIHRRVVARKLRNGRLLGIFDFALYSGDPGKDLCKIGVSQSDVTYDPFNCGAVTTSANAAVPFSSIEAENMGGATDPDDGAKVEPSASSGAVFAYAHGITASITVNTIAFSSMTIIAREETFNAVHANMRVTVDSTVIYDGPVNTTTLSDFDTSVGSYAAGSHTITIQFTNDGCGSPSCGPGNDRNLYVDRIDLNP